MVPYQGPGFGRESFQKPTIRSTKTQRFLTTSLNHMLSDKLSLRMKLHELLGWIYSKSLYLSLYQNLQFQRFSSRITWHWMVSQAAGPLSLIIILSIFVYFSANFVIWQYLIVNLTRFLIQVISSVVYLNPFHSIEHVFWSPSREIKTYLKSCMIFS